MVLMTVFVTLFCVRDFLQSAEAASTSSKGFS